MGNTMFKPILDTYHRMGKWNFIYKIFVIKTRTAQAFWNETMAVENVWHAMKFNKSKFCRTDCIINVSNKLTLWDTFVNLHTWLVMPLCMSILLNQWDLRYTVQKIRNQQDQQPLPQGDLPHPLVLVEILVMERLSCLVGSPNFWKYSEWRSTFVLL